MIVDAWVFLEHRPCYPFSTKGPEHFEDIKSYVPCRTGNYLLSTLSCFVLRLLSVDRQERFCSSHLSRHQSNLIQKGGSRVRFAYSNSNQELGAMTSTLVQYPRMVDPSSAI